MTKKMTEIFVIQTPNDDERKESFTREFASQEFPELEISLTYAEAVMDWTMPQRGISTSHRSIVQYAHNNNLDEVLILEDDVCFLDKMALAKLINLSKLIPKDCDLLFAGLYDGKIGEEFSNYARVEGKISGLHCYIVKKKFYEKFLSADPIYNLDSYLSTELKAVSYCMYPFVAIQHEGHSYNRKTTGGTSHNYNLHKKYKLTNDGKRT